MSHFHRCCKFSINSETMTNPEPPSTSSRVILPPGTSSGSSTDDDDDEFEFLSDQDIAAGITPNNTNTIISVTQNNEKKWPSQNTCSIY